MENREDETTCLRKTADRRKCPTPMFSRYTFFGGKRKHIRRDCDRKKHIFVDVYSTRLLIAVLTLLLFSIADAYLTLILIEKGKVFEANPLMAFCLDLGIMPFAIIKFVVTGFALIVLCLFKNVNLTRISLPIAIKIYLAVIIYEIYLYMI